MRGCRTWEEDQAVIDRIMAACDAARQMPSIRYVQFDCPACAEKFFSDKECCPGCGWEWKKDLCPR